jgi:hypothetical protein
VAGWDDLVTTALLGTDRRPVPAGLPALWSGAAAADPAETVLDHAARHRAATRAGVRPPTCAAPEPAPDQAGELAPEHWTAAANVAASARGVDRARLARALGERGIWFVGQNPQWARLAASLRAALQEDDAE